MEETEKIMEHVIVIGGSGILRGLCIHWAEEGKVVSVVGRDKAKIVEMVAQTQKAPGLINPVAVDYLQVPTLQKKLIEAVAHLGRPTMTVTWIRPEGFLARQSVAGFLNDQASGSRLFDLACAQSDPVKTAGLLSAHNFKIMYRRVILSAAAGGDGSDQKVRDRIREGMLKAIRLDQTDFIIS